MQQAAQLQLKRAVIGFQSEAVGARGHRGGLLGLLGKLGLLLDLEPPLERPHLEVELVDALLYRGRNGFLRGERSMKTRGEPAEEGEGERGVSHRNNLLFSREPPVARSAPG
ncbi:MAG: hypothetical protein M3436_14420 [Pseudomonadota bacterium]|nr:hypothetical protein [Pseudomonadota bacterium]